MAKGSGESFEPPYFPKFWNYQRFFNDFYDGAGRFLFDEDRLFHVWPFPAEKILIAGFNSCIIESEQDGEHYGHIGVDQVRQVLLACDDVDPDNTWLRIAALHHNFIGGSDLDNENLRDRDDILPLLQKGKFRLVLHGHRHIAEAQQFGSVKHETIRVLAAGSAGLDCNALPDHPNQYQVIRIDESGEVSVFMRQFSAQAFGLSGKGKWAADTSVDESGIVRFTLASPSQPTQSAKGKKKQSGSFETARKKFLTFVREEMKFPPLRGFGVDLRVPLELEPFYISLRAMPHHDFDMRDHDTRDHDTEDRPDDLSEPPEPPDREIDSPQELEIGPALSLSEQQGYAGLVVLGDPGSGKTTLLKYVALCLAKGRRETRSRIPKGRLPLFLPLRDVVAFEHPLEETLRRHYARNGLTLPDDFFTRILGARRCVILLDGLDEVAPLDRRRDAGRWIEAARKVWPGVTQLEGDAGISPFAFQLDMSTIADHDVSFVVRTDEGTATTNDFSPIADLTLTIPAGQKTATIVVDVIAERRIEPDESFTLTLSNPSDANLDFVGGQTTLQTVGTIVSEDRTAHIITTTAGTTGTVKISDAVTGETIRTIRPFAVTFAGDVRVATGDFNGDGRDDVVTAAGPSGGPHVRVFDVVSGSQLLEFFAYDASFRGGVNVAAADFNRDGVADIVTGAGGGPRVRVFDGTNARLLFDFAAYDSSFTGGVFVAAGDVTGDGIPDIVTGAGPGGGPTVRVFDGRDARRVLSISAFDASFDGGVSVATGNFDGDKYADT